MPKTKRKKAENEIIAQSLNGQQAEDFFPDLFPNTAKDVPETRPVVLPPPPPASWEENDDADSRGDDEGRYALLLARDEEQRAMIEKTLGRLGYTTIVAASAARGIEELRIAPYQLVLCGADATFARFREYLTKNMPQSRRRLIYYALLGPRLRTCYNMEALALSANMVINEQDLPDLEGILRKGFMAYQRLFGPYLEVLDENERLQLSR